MPAPRIAVILFATACALSAQAFESISIQPAAAQSDDEEAPRASGAMLYRNVSLKLLAAAAWNVRPDRVTGPTALDRERYDIAAKPPVGATKDQVPAMLRNLLADRFAMVAHVETRQQPGYALLITEGGPKLPRTGPITGVNIGVAKDHVDITGASLPAFAGMLTNYLGRPVADQTQLSGSYDFHLNVTMAELKAASPRVFTAIQELGLKLEARETPVTWLIVDESKPPKLDPASPGN